MTNAELLARRGKVTILERPKGAAVLIESPDGSTLMLEGSTKDQLIVELLAITKNWPER